MRAPGRATAFGQFFRMAAFFSSACPVLGGYALVGVVGARQLVLIVAVAFCYHAFSALTNDIRDRELDSTDPRRMHMPIASGRVSTGWAWVVVAVCSGLGLVICAFAAGSVAVLTFAVACALVGVYNWFGKLAPVPFVADLVAGASVGVLVLLGSALAGEFVPAALLLGLSIALYVAQVTGLQGPIRDYDNDREYGVRTTAGWLCRYQSTLPSVLPRRAVVVGFLYQAATCFAFVGALTVIEAPVRLALVVGVVMQAAALTVAVVQVLHNATVEQQGRLSVPVALLTLLSFATPIIATSGVWSFVAVVAASAGGWFVSPAGRGQVYRRASLRAPEHDRAGMAR